MSSHMRELPDRPALPPLFFASLSAWVTLVLVELISWHRFTAELSDNHVAAIIVSILLFSCVVFFVKRRFLPKRTFRTSPLCPSSNLALIAVSACIAFICGSVFWSCWSQDVEDLQAAFEQEASIRIELTSDPSERDYGIVSNAQALLGGHRVQVRMIWPDETEPLFSGHMLSVQGSVPTPQAIDSGRWSHQNGFAGTIKASSVEDIGFSNDARRFLTEIRDDAFANLSALEEDSAGLLAGVVLGNKTIFSGTELELAFQTTGLAHMMAVSGTHLSIVTVLLATVLSRSKLRRKARASLLICTLLAYVAITNFAASAIRACSMCCVALVAGSLHRRSNIIGSLALCIFVFMGISPCIIFSAGFQLSVLAVLGLTVFGSLTACWISRLLPMLPNAIASSLAATIVASFATLPVTVPLFAQLPLISPLSNLIAAPMIAVILCLGIIGTLLSVALPAIGMPVITLAGIASAACARTVCLLADIPGACLPVSSEYAIIAAIFALLMVTLWIAWPLPKGSCAHDGENRLFRQFAALSCACAVIALPFGLAIFLGFGQFAIEAKPGDSRLVMLDVGQGDSILIQSGDASVLVDTGEKSDVLIRELAEKSVSHLDAIFITHKDADHAGALEKLAGIIDIDHVYVHDDLIGKEFAEPVLKAARWTTAGKGAEGVKPGFCVKVGEFALTVLSPQEGGMSKNDDSLVILVEFDEGNDGTTETRGLLTGDAEQEALKDLVPAIGDIDFLKVAHHGSKGGLNEEELTVLSPELALISVGQGNRYGHPAQETLFMLEKTHARVFRTDEQGAISVRFAKEGMSVSTER